MNRDRPHEANAKRVSQVAKTTQFMSDPQAKWDCWLAELVVPGLPQWSSTAAAAISADTAAFVWAMPEPSGIASPARAIDMAIITAITRATPGVKTL
jgi:hypothetical protein